MLCGLCSWKHKRIAVCVALTVVISVSMFFAWSTVYAPDPDDPDRAESRWSAKLTQPSWPFWTDDYSHYFYRGDMVIWFIGREGFPIVQRIVWYPEYQTLGHGWNDVINQEFFRLLTLVNVVGGVLGLLVSWVVIGHLALRTPAFPTELTLVKLTLLGIGLFLILLGVLTSVEGNPFLHGLQNEVFERGMVEFSLGVSAFFGSILLGIATTPASRTEKNGHQNARASSPFSFSK